MINSNLMMYHNNKSTQFYFQNPFCSQSLIGLILLQKSFFGACVNRKEVCPSCIANLELNFARCLSQEASILQGGTLGIWMLTLLCTKSSDKERYLKYITTGWYGTKQSEWPPLKNPVCVSDRCQLNVLAGLEKAERILGNPWEGPEGNLFGYGVHVST